VESSSEFLTIDSRIIDTLPSSLDFRLGKSIIWILWCKEIKRGGNPEIPRLNLDLILDADGVARMQIVLAAKSEHNWSNVRLPKRQLWPIYKLPGSIINFDWQLHMFSSEFLPNAMIRPSDYPIQPPQSRKVPHQDPLTRIRSGFVAWKPKKFKFQNSV